MAGPPKFILSEADRQILAEAVIDYMKRKGGNYPGRGGGGDYIYHQEHQAPEVYVAKVGSSNIDPIYRRIDEEEEATWTGTGTGTATYVSSGLADVFEIQDDGERKRLIAIGIDEQVYNLSNDHISANTWVLVKRDKGGVWWVVRSDSRLPEGPAGCNPLTYVSNVCKSGTDIIVEYTTYDPVACRITNINCVTNPLQCCVGAVSLPCCPNVQIPTILPITITAVPADDCCISGQTFYVPWISGAQWYLNQPSCAPGWNIEIDIQCQVVPTIYVHEFIITIALIGPQSVKWLFERDQLQPLFFCNPLCVHYQAIGWTGTSLYPYVPCLVPGTYQPAMIYAVLGFCPAGTGTGTGTGGGGGGGSVLTSCCPDGIPTTLQGTVTDGGTGCACLTGATFTLTWNSLDSKWVSAPVTDCQSVGLGNFVFKLSCGTGNIFKLEAFCDAVLVWDVSGYYTANCVPFTITFTPPFAATPPTACGNCAPTTDPTITITE